MSSKIPENPSQPFDGSHLTDDEVRRLTKAQWTWAQLTDAQYRVFGQKLTEDEITNPPPPRAFSEAVPERIPAPEELNQIKELFGWIDWMHDKIRQPSGMTWVEVQLSMNGASQLLDWVNSDPPIDRLYRYRIDSPMDPNAQVPDHMPEEWGKS